MERELDTFKEDLKDADNELKEVEYNLYKTLHMFESLEHFNDGEKIKMLFQMENDRILAESLSNNETTMSLEEEENYRILSFDPRKIKNMISPIQSKLSFDPRKVKNMINTIQSDIDKILEKKHSEQKLSISEMTKLMKESELSNYLVTKNNKQKKKRKLRKRKKEKEKQKQIIFI